MRPAIEVWRDALNAYYVTDCHQKPNTGEHLAAVAVIEADREAVVREIIHMLRHDMDDWADYTAIPDIADEIECKFLGKDA